MSLLAVILGGAITGVSCGGNDRPASDDGDDTGHDADEQTCAELTDEWEGIIDSLATSCTTAADCEYFGASAWDYCECFPRISGRWGTVATAVVTQAVRDQLQALEAAYTSRCTDCAQPGVLCLCDGEYAVGAECYEGQCVPELEGCLPQPYDAAVDAGWVPDASLADATP